MIFAVLKLCHFAIATCTLSYAFSLAIPTSILNLLFDAGVKANCDPILFGFLKIERTADLILGIVICAVLFWSPLRARRNVVIWLGGFMIYALSRWAGLLLTNLEPHYTRGLSVGMLAVSLACLVGWTVLLNAKGETEAAPLQRQIENGEVGLS
jgi:hypothetical protein